MTAARGVCIGLGWMPWRWLMRFSWVLLLSISLMWFLEELSRAVFGTWLFWGRPRQAGWQARLAGRLLRSYSRLPFKKQHDYPSHDSYTVVYCPPLDYDPYVPFHGFLTLDPTPAYTRPGSVPPLSHSFSISHTLIMVARRGFEYSFSRLWVWRAVVTLYVRYGVWEEVGLVGSKDWMVVLM